MEKFTSINVKIGHGTSVHYAWATNSKGEAIQKIRTFCGMSGAGGGMRNHDLGISGETKAPVTCKSCLKGMVEANKVLGR